MMKTLAVASLLTLLALVTLAIKRYVEWQAARPVSAKEPISNATPSTGFAR